MRRNDKQITNQQELIHILKNNNICRIALSEDNCPYIVPMNYGYSDSKLYLHSAKEGKKIDILKKNNHVCFEITDSIKIHKSDIACNYGTRYRSIIGMGNIFMVNEFDKKVDALKIIMKQHTGRSEWDFDAARVNRIHILEIHIEDLTGKVSGEI